MLGLRDDGDTELVALMARYLPYSRTHWRAGMVIRREAALDWVKEIDHDPRRRMLDRTGVQLVSGGDNDIVITAMKLGSEMGYFPELMLTHLGFLHLGAK